MTSLTSRCIWVIIGVQIIREQIWYIECYCYFVVYMLYLLSNIWFLFIFAEKPTRSGALLTAKLQYKQKTFTRSSTLSSKNIVVGYLFGKVPTGRDILSKNVKCFIHFYIIYMAQTYGGHIQPEWNDIRRSELEVHQAHGIPSGSFQEIVHIYTYIYIHIYIHITQIYIYIYVGCSANEFRYTLFRGAHEHLLECTIECASFVDAKASV